MKKIILLLSGITLFVNTSDAQKAFEKGTFTISAGAGVAIYGTEIQREYNKTIWNGVVNTTTRVTENNNDAAASMVIPFVVEYGVSNWLGIGGRFAYSKYYASADSTNNNTKPTVTGYDGDLILNLHFIKTKHFDLPICLIVGYSNFTYKANNKDTNSSPDYDNGNAMAKDNGLNYGIALVPRIYFGDHIGIFFNLGYMGYNYPSLLFSNNSDSNLNNDNNENQVFKLKGNGANVGLGLIVKF